MDDRDVAKNENPDEMLTIQLGDQSSVEVPRGTTIATLLKQSGGADAREAVAAKINGKVVDLLTPLEENVAVEVVSFNDKQGADVYRHTAGHVMAQAVKRLYGDVRLGIGPPIEDGFYYDFHFDEPLSPEELA